MTKLPKAIVFGSTTWHEARVLPGIIVAECGLTFDPMDPRVYTGKSLVLAYARRIRDRLTVACSHCGNRRPAWELPKYRRLVRQVGAT